MGEIPFSLCLLSEDGCVRRDVFCEGWIGIQTSFPFGEGYMTSRFILNKFDLDLSSSCLLVFWLLAVVVVVFGSAVSSVVVVYERVVCDGGWGADGGLWGGYRVGGCGGREHVEGALAFAHCVVLFVCGLYTGWVD